LQATLEVLLVEEEVVERDRRLSLALERGGEPLWFRRESIRHSASTVTPLNSLLKTLFQCYVQWTMDMEKVKMLADMLALNHYLFLNEGSIPFL
jgi:hypothetical protein